MATPCHGLSSLLGTSCLILKYIECHTFHFLFLSNLLPLFLLFVFAFCIFVFMYCGLSNLINAGFSFLTCLPWCSTFGSCFAWSIHLNRWSVFTYCKFKGSYLAYYSIYHSCACLGLHSVHHYWGETIQCCHDLAWVTWGAATRKMLHCY